MIGEVVREHVKDIRVCPIPLPPLGEQNRIVAKVNELTALCDAPETELTQSRVDADTNAAAFVHRLCADAR